MQRISFGLLAELFYSFLWHFSEYGAIIGNEGFPVF